MVTMVVLLAAQKYDKFNKVNKKVYVTEFGVCPVYVKQASILCVGFIWQ